MWTAKARGKNASRCATARPFAHSGRRRPAYIGGTYWICYSIPLGVGGGILKSTTGKPEGPCERVFKDGPVVNAIDLALFEDDDSKVYLIWGAGNIRQLSDDLTGFVGEGWKLKPANADRIGFEGTFVFKAHGRYCITGAEFVADPGGGEGADYHCYAVVGDSLREPFGDKFLAIPHTGHNSFFRDRDGNCWAAFFGNDPRAPFRASA
ncbi:MAG: family 43 glycosylhydrolase [Opitutaceae bacterium]